MTSFDTTRATYGASTPRAATLFGHLSSAFAAWNDTRRTARALRSLTDRELADIGLNRGDIATVANNDFIR